MRRWSGLFCLACDSTHDEDGCKRNYGCTPNGNRSSVVTEDEGDDSRRQGTQRGHNPKNLSSPRFILFASQRDALHLLKVAGILLRHR